MHVDDVRADVHAVVFVAHVPIEHGELRARFADDVRERRGIDLRIHGDCRAARAHDSEIRERPIGMIFRRQDDAIAAHDATFDESRRNLIRPRAYVFERDARKKISFEIAQRHSVTVTLRHFVDE